MSCDRKNKMKDDPPHFGQRVDNIKRAQGNLCITLHCNFEPELLHILGRCTQHLKNHMFNNPYLFWGTKESLKNIQMGVE